MSDQDDRKDPIGDIGEEAAKLVGAVQQRVMRGMAGAGMAAASRDRDDVWSKATKEPEGQVSPIERLVEISRTAAPRVAGHLFQAGTALFAAARDVVDAVEETRTVRREPDPGPDPSRFVDAGSGRTAESRTAPRTESRTDEPADPWAAVSDEVPDRRRDDGDDGIEHIDIG